MKTLSIVRHAKSSWDSPELDDFDRPLNKRGKRDSVMMGERLLVQQRLPQRIVCSPALRAITTAKRMAKAMRLDQSLISTDSALYEADCDTLYDCVWSFDDDCDDMMLVGHNPGLSDLAQSLCRKNVAPLVTCAIIMLRFDCDAWHKIVPHSGEPVLSDFPKSETTWPVIN